MDIEHKTAFEDMEDVQRSIHNLICIIDDDCELTYLPSLSRAIDRITELKQQRDELLEEFKKRVKHDATWCAKMRDGNMDCDCGRDAAIAKAVSNE